MVDITKITPIMVLKALFLQQYKKGYFAVNSVFSGLNETLKKHFDLDPIAFTKDLESRGLITIRGNKTTNKNGKVTKSVIFWLTEKGMVEFGIRPPQANAKGNPESKPSKLIAETAKMFSIS